jgi:hypothetical protein
VVALLFWAIPFSGPNSQGYSVLTHEELIDLARNDSIRHCC